MFASHFNPIKNLWAELKRAVNKCKSTDVKDPAWICMAKWSNITANVFINLVKHYRKGRHGVILALNGKPIIVPVIMKQHCNLATQSRFTSAKLRG